MRRGRAVVAASICVVAVAACAKRQARPLDDAPRVSACDTLNIALIELEKATFKTDSAVRALGEVETHPLVKILGAPLAPFAIAAEAVLAPVNAAKLVANAGVAAERAALGRRHTAAGCESPDSYRARPDVQAVLSAYAARIAAKEAKIRAAFKAAAPTAVRHVKAIGGFDPKWRRRTLAARLTKAKVASPYGDRGWRVGDVERLIRETNIVAAHRELVDTPGSGYGVWQQMTLARAYVDALPTSEKCGRRNHERMTKALRKQGFFDHDEQNYQELVDKRWQWNQNFRQKTLRVTTKSMDRFFAAYRAEQKRRGDQPPWPANQKNKRFWLVDCDGPPAAGLLRRLGVGG